MKTRKNLGRAFHHNARRRHRRVRHFHKNPPAFLKAAGGSVVDGLKGGALGALAIAANKAISHQVNSLVFGTSNSMKPLVELASAVLLLPMLARVTKMRGLQEATVSAAAVTIFDLGKTYLPASVKSALEGGYEFPKELTPPAEVELSGDNDGALPIPSIYF